MLNYNDVDLEDILKVININTTLISERENNSISIPSRDGELYNGFRYGTKKIEIVADVKKNTDNDYFEIRDELNGIFDVEKPQPLYIDNTGRFYFSVFDGAIKEERISNGYFRITINFICYDPFAYSEDAKQYDGANYLLCTNEGSVQTYPIINVGISNDAHFVQVENVKNKKKILIGQYPSTASSTVKEKTNILIDDCEATTDWVTGSTSIDNDRASTGTLSITSSGNGIMAGDYGTKSTGATWYGTSARKNLGTQVDDFYVECVMKHNSTGMNGDPSVGQNDTDTVVSGSKKTFYKVTADSLNVRSGPGTKYRRVGSLKKGTKVYPSSISKGWAKITYNGSTAYVCDDYLKKYKGDSTVTLKERNYVCGTNTAIRSTYKKTSNNTCTIPAGTTIRCNYDVKYLDPTDKEKKRHYFKLAKKYKGHMGYVMVDNLTQASDTYYEYEDELNTADDKTGLVELYGYTVNGEKLFRIGLYDDNEFYEFTYPLIEVGSKDFLKDKTVAPAPKIKTTASESDDKLTVTKDTLLSGRYGSWNEFYGKIGIQRKAGKWKAWVYKIEDGKTVKTLKKGEVKVSGSPTGNLAYIVAYFGTSADSSEKASNVAINHIEVKNLTPETSKTNKNVAIFEEGDTLKIDCYNNRVYLNNKPFNSKIDIGSQFFPLEIGDNTIKVMSDDKELSSTIIFNERWL